MLDALIRTRDAISDPLQSGPLAAGKPALRCPRIETWDPWVRTYLAVQGLMEGIRFEAPQPSPVEPRAAFELRVLSDQSAREVSVYASADDSRRLVKIVRPRHQVFERQLEQVFDWAELRPERYSEILAQIDNQYAFWGSVVPLNMHRMRRTAQLIEAVTQFCVFVEARFKHEFNAWRPADLSPQVQPIITTPGHGSFPSGHCTQSYAVAHVLGYLLGVTNPDTGDHRESQLQRLAARVSMNRVVAGVHFPVDNLVGRLLGRCLGEYVVSRCTPGPPGWTPRYFNGHATALLETEIFDPSAQSLNALSTSGTHYYEAWGPAVQAPARSALLEQLWAAADTECEYLR